MSLFIKETNQIVNKGWGKEIIFVNNGEYCGKILCFDELKKFSMHFHMRIWLSILFIIKRRKQQ